MNLLMLPAAAALLLTPGEDEVRITVAKDGTGDYRTVQEAVDGAPSGKPASIFVKNGTYAEKVYIRRSHLTIVGEDREGTKILYAELRENWNRAHGGSDFGAGVVNIDTGVSDITLANLTVENNYGSLYGARGHQFAIRGAGTRIVLLGCDVKSDGGDALSLWNRDDGMYYHAECRFEGWVDYVCPRGWCYIRESQFYGHNTPSASIWHDGSRNRDQKFVICDSYFDGVPGFPLGRNHLDAAFYIIRCRFSRHMADRPFSRPPSSPREWIWGDRHYFYGCHRDSADYAWFGDNIAGAEGTPHPDSVNARWTFGGRWDPEASISSLLPYAILPWPRDSASGVDPAGVRLRWISPRGVKSGTVRFGRAGAPPEEHAVPGPAFDTGPLAPRTTYVWSVEEGAGGRMWHFTTR